MYRTKSFDEMLSKQLQNPEFAREYILASMEGEEGVSITEALFEVISLMGTSEFADLVKMKRQSISRMLSSGDIPKIETFNKLLSPFKLQIKLDVEKVA